MSPAHSHRARTTKGRALVIGLVVVAIGGGVAVARQLGPSQPAAPVTLLPTSIAPDASSSSALTCGGMGINGDFVASANIEITNTSDAPRDVTALVMSDTGGRQSAPTFTVAAKSTWTFNPVHVVGKGSWLAVRLVTNGGGVSAVMVPTSGRSSTVTPCISQTSTHWYFSGGSTSHGDQINYAIVNPTITPAVVNVTLVDASGVLSPQNAQGLVVAPGSELLLSGTAEAPHSSSLAASITAEQGTVVAFATQMRPSTLSSVIMSGQSSLATASVLAHASQDPVSSQVLCITNPTATTSTVTVTAHTPYGKTAPWVEAVPAFSSWNLTLTGASRIPLAAPYALTVDATGQGVSTTFIAQAEHASHASLAMIPLEPVGTASQAVIPWAGLSLTSLTLFNAGATSQSVTVSGSTTANHYVVAPGALLAVAPSTLSTSAFTEIHGSVVAGASYSGAALPSLSAFAALAKN